MSSQADPTHQAEVLIELFERALPQVHGYLLTRCSNKAVAEDLTAETFAGAVASVRAGAVREVTVAWLVGIARHKLVDHWRAQAREERKLAAVGDDAETTADPWHEEVDVAVAREVLAELASQHRAVLSLRYLDGLSVPVVAEHLGRTVHATEALLIRAKAAFRRVYAERRIDRD